MVEKFTRYRYSWWVLGNPLILTPLLAGLLAWANTPTPLEQALERHVAFLANDRLLGRATPSPGLTEAAEYIEKAFRAAGLEPIDGSYTQDVTVQAWLPQSQGTLVIGNQPYDATGSIQWRTAFPVKQAVAVQRADVTLVKKTTDLKNASTHSVILFDGAASLSDLMAWNRTSYAAILLAKWSKLPPVEACFATPYAGPPIIYVEDEAIWHQLQVPDSQVDLTLTPSTPVEVTLANVMGTVTGSDPQLQQEYFVVGAHYDHVGHALNDGFPRGMPSRTDPDDLIWNGANDNASSVAALIECAIQLKRNPPARSLLFVAFFGEESGFLGSSYFVENSPVEPSNIAAMINLEQLGRTDELNLPPGTPRGSLSMTGYSYSTVPAILATRAPAHGLHLYRHPSFSDAYFRRSDNGPFAEAGIPAHTMSASYAFPDYHGAGDETDLVEFPYLAQVTRFLVDAVSYGANQPDRPRWLVDEFE